MHYNNDYIAIIYKYIGIASYCNGDYMDIAIMII